MGNCFSGFEFQQQEFKFGIRKEKEHSSRIYPELVCDYHNENNNLESLSYELDDEVEEDSTSNTEHEQLGTLKSPSIKISRYIELPIIPKDFFSQTSTAKEGNLTSSGWQIYSDGSIYKGSRLGAVPDGLGTYTPKDISKISYLKGEWSKGLFIYGEIEFPGSGVYNGSISKLAKFSGKGKFVYKNGEYISGNFADHQFQIGVHFCNIYKYEGEFRKGLRNGYGKCSWKTGEVYEGRWKGGLMDGFGYMGKNGKILSNGKLIGSWRNGVLDYTAEDCFKKIKALKDSYLERKSEIDQEKSKENLDLDYDEIDKC